MSIIDQLEKTVTPAVLGQSDSKDSVAHVSLLEQFYAILAARLALPQVYSQLLRTDQLLATNNGTETTLFKQLWQDHEMQQTIIQELSATHHIDESMTSELLINSSPLAYRELKILANGQFLPAFLQGEQAALRQYLPIWSAPIIAASSGLNNEVGSKTIAEVRSVLETDTVLDKFDRPNVETSATSAMTEADIDSTETERANDDLSTNLGAIHANPSAHHLAENSSIKQAKVRTRNQRNDLLVKVFLLVLAIAAMALAAWALLIKPNNVPPVEPIATVPVVAAPAAPVEVLTPVELIVGMDNSGGLTSCSAVVGDEALQNALQQAFNTSFGQQASTCELTVRAGVANSVANLPMEILPNILNMLRAVPFARLELQNDRLTLAAPDSTLLQRLVTDIRTLAPAMIIESKEPLPLPDNSNGDSVNGLSGMNEMGGQFANGEAALNNQYGNGDSNGGSGEFQAADDNTGDRMLPAPNNGMNNNAMNEPVNNTRNIPNNAPTNNRPSGPISESELDDLAGTSFIVEPAQVRN
ncbi:hypothetical protein I6E61_02195 [Psychrobacter sp. NZS113]|uniref:hypothetical protein n=1 Tax=Psychrobacter sp. NZS113 TaxID=2792045 RepID=UPI0018CF9DF0|nr:hypothetical protein [Psychrobacter sp. NZS113]MBH0095194.1 hypothetical protein [Psychrobacter sp. NZS113]